MPCRSDDLGCRPRSRAWSRSCRRSPRRWRRPAPTGSSARPTGAPTRKALRCNGSEARRTPTSRPSGPCAPDLVVANKEENRELDVRRLRASGRARVGDRDRDGAGGPRLPRAAVSTTCSASAPRGGSRAPGRSGAAPCRRPRSRWPWPSGVTRGWSSAATPSPATSWRASAGATSSPRRADRYPHVELGGARLRGRRRRAAARRALRLHGRGRSGGLLPQPSRPRQWSPAHVVRPQPRRGTGVAEAAVVG